MAEKHTAKQEILGTIKMMGPVILATCVNRVREQVVGCDDFQDYQAAELLTELIREGKVRVYDTGDAFDVALEPVHACAKCGSGPGETITVDAKVRNATGCDLDLLHKQVHPRCIRLVPCPYCGEYYLYKRWHTACCHENDVPIRKG